MNHTPQRMRTCRDDTHALQRTAVQGFGMYSSLGVRWFEALVTRFQNVRGTEVPYIRIEALPGLPGIVDRFLALQASSPVNAMLSNGIHNAREAWRRDPKGAEQSLKYVRMISRFSDFQWRLVSAALRFNAALRAGDSSAAAAAAVFFLAAAAVAVRRRRSA